MNILDPRKMLVPALELVRNHSEISINVYVAGDSPNIFSISSEKGIFIVNEEAVPEDEEPYQIKTLKEMIDFLKYEFITIITMTSLVNIRGKQKTITLFKCDPESGESCYETINRVRRNEAASLIQDKYLERRYRPGGSTFLKAQSDFEKNQQFGRKKKDSY